MNDSGDFFDLQSVSRHDRRIMDEHLAGAAGPQVVVSGHTHAAREVRLSDSRVFLNTGTWADLMRFPTTIEDDSALMSWFADLKRGAAPRLRRLTFAEITPETAALGFWQPAASAATTEPGR